MPYKFNAKLAQEFKSLIDQDHYALLYRFIINNRQSLNLSLEPHVFCNLLYYAMKNEKHNAITCILKHFEGISLSLISENTNIKQDISVMMKMSIWVLQEPIKNETILQEIINYLKQQSKQEYDELLKNINTSQSDFISGLMRVNRFDLLVDLLAMGVLPNKAELAAEFESITIAGINIKKANLISVVVLMGNPEALKTLLIALDRESMTDFILQHKTVFTEHPKIHVIFEPAAIFITKYFYQVYDAIKIPNRNVTPFCYWEDLFQINKTYESLVETLKLSQQDKNLLDMLLIAGTNPRGMDTLLLRQQQLWKNIIEYTIKNTVICLYKMMLATGFNLSVEIKNLIITFALSASHSAMNPERQVPLLASRSLLFYAKYTVKMPQSSVDFIIQQNLTNYQNTFSLTYKLALLGFKARRQNQPLREEDTCARDVTYCKNLVNLIHLVITDNWHIIKPLFDKDHQLFMTIYKDKMMKIDLRKSEIVNAIKEIIRDLKGEFIQQPMSIQVDDEEQRTKFNQNFARQVMCYFNDERATFRFWNGHKERADLQCRIEGVAINYVDKLQHLDEEAMKNLVVKLAMSNFTIKVIENILDQETNQNTKREKRNLQRADQVRLKLSRQTPRA